MAVEQETYDLVRDQLAAGKTEADIRPMLEKVGYSRVEIAEVFLHAKTHPVGTTPKQVQKSTYSEPVTPKPTAQKQYVPLGTPEPAVKSIPKPASKKPITLYIGLIAIIVVALLGTFLFVLPMLGPEEIVVESGDSASLGALDETEQYIAAAENSTISFSIDGESHRAEIEEISGDSVTIAIFSEVHRITLRIGETKEIDLDGDGETDFSISLNAIEDGKARIQIRKMHREQKGNGEKNGPACTEGKKVNLECYGSDSMKFKECINGQWVSDTELCPIPTVYVQNGYYEGYCENVQCKTRLKCNSGHSLDNGQCVAETPNCTGTINYCSDSKCKVFHPYDPIENPNNPSGSYSCDKTDLCDLVCKGTSWYACSHGSQCCDEDPSVSCEDIIDEDDCVAVGCDYGAVSGEVCDDGETKSCTTSDSCPGIKTCSNNVWGSCVDVAGDDCPAAGTVACSSASDCDDGDPCTVQVCNFPGEENSFCANTPITACQIGDGCCPTGCTYEQGDTDCTPVGGNPTGGTATSHPEATILSHNVYVWSNAFRVVGEVKNTGTQNIKWISLDVDFLDAQDNVVDSGFSWQDIQILRPGEKSTFSVTTLDLFDHYELESSLGTMPYTTEEPYDDFEITQHSNRIEGNRYYVSGDIKNIGAENRSNLHMFVAFYDSSGDVVATEDDMITGGLDIDETTQFEAWAYTDGVVAPIDSYSISFRSWF